MNKTELLNKVSRTAHKVGFKLKKHSPEILVVAGVVGIVTSTVMACKATTKAGDILEKAKKDLDDIHKCNEIAKTQPEALPEEYNENDYKKDLAVVYAQTGFEFVKLYAPAVILGTLSIGAMLTSNNILRKRNVALAAAYATVDKSFKEYRGRVVERFGREIDRELKYNIKAQEIEEIVQNEDGTETVVKKTVNVIDPSTIDDMSRIWYEGSQGWSDDAEYRLFYLRKQQEFATAKLRTEGYLLLNDVYEMLGFPKTPAGNVIGWIYDEKNPVGDNYVDFGLYDLDNPKTNDFVNGDERGVILQFNHDGNILDKM